MMNNASTTKQAWLVRPKPHNIPRIHEFRQKGIVAIGWPGIGDLTGKSRQEIKLLLSQPPYRYTDRMLGNVYATVDIIVNRMKPGDLVMVPDGDDIYFGEITGGYSYDSSVDNDTDGYPHQRAVSWFPVNVARQELSKELCISLRAPRTAANLSEHGHTKEIDTLAHGGSFQPAKEDASGVTQVSYPLRPDHVITFTIPNDTTKQEAQRLSQYFASLYFKE